MLLLTWAECSQSELIGRDSSRHPPVRPWVYTFKHVYLGDEKANRNQTFSEAPLIVSQPPTPLALYRQDYFTKTTLNVVEQVAYETSNLLLRILSFPRKCGYYILINCNY